MRYTAEPMPSKSLRNRQLLIVASAASLLLPASAVSSVESSHDLRKCVQAISRRPHLGHLGIGIYYFDTGQEFFVNGHVRFPMQSVFKAPLAVAVLDQVDAGKLALYQKITIMPSDLSIAYSPLRDKFSSSAQSYTIADLITCAIAESDNTAADVLMKLVGGPEHVTALLNGRGITGLRIDRYERIMQPEIFGISPYSNGHLIDQQQWTKLKQQMNLVTASHAFNRHLHQDQRDTLTPAAALQFLRLLYDGKLLSEKSTSFLISVMESAQTGPHRLREALPPGAKLAHKTGTGPDFEGINSATNDIGVVTLPSGKKIAIAVLLSGSRLSEDGRDQVIRDICKCAIFAVPGGSSKVR